MEPCSCCGKLFRCSDTAALFDGKGERVCLDCIREWWPKRYEQLAEADKEFLERRLADWLIRYHHGRAIRQLQEVLQIPLQEFLVVASCECGGEKANCSFCDGHGNLWVIAPE